MNKIRYYIVAAILLACTLIFYAQKSNAEDFYYRCEEHKNIIETVDQKTLNYIFKTFKIHDNDIECLIKIGHLSYDLLTFDGIILGFNIKQGILDNMPDKPMDKKDEEDNKSEEQNTKNTASKEEVSAIKTEAKNLLSKFKYGNDLAALDELVTIIKNPYWWQYAIISFLAYGEHSFNDTVGEYILRSLGDTLKNKDGGYVLLIELYDYATDNFNFLNTGWIYQITNSAIREDRAVEALNDLENLFSKNLASDDAKENMKFAFNACHKLLQNNLNGTDTE